MDITASTTDSAIDAWGVASPAAAPLVTGTIRPARSRPPEVRYVPACGGNVGAGRITGDAMCVGALVCADTPAVDDIGYYRLTAPAGTAVDEGGWTVTGQICRGTNAPAEEADPVMTLEDFRRLPIQPGKVNVQPASLRSLVNIPTNFYVEADAQLLPTELVGVPVQVRATPQQFVWAFGDGETLTTEDPGAPYPDLRTTHTYRRTGPMTLTLTARFGGEYSVAGGPWLPIPGQAEVASPPVTLTLLQARAELIAPS